MSERENSMTFDEKMQILQIALESVREAMEMMMKGCEEIAGGLEMMTEHYVQLAGCGDCGNWDPEKEEKVIAAREILSQFKQGKAEFDEAIKDGSFDVGTIASKAHLT